MSLTRVRLLPPPEPFCTICGMAPCQVGGKRSTLANNKMCWSFIILETFGSTLLVRTMGGPTISHLAEIQSCIMDISRKANKSSYLGLKHKLSSQPSHGRESFQSFHPLLLPRCARVARIFTTKILPPATPST